MLCSRLWEYLIHVAPQINDSKGLRSRILQDAYGTAPRVYILQHTFPSSTPNQRNVKVFLSQKILHQKFAKLPLWHHRFLSKINLSKVNFETHFPTIHGLQGRHYRADADGILDLQFQNVQMTCSLHRQVMGKNKMKLEQDGTSP